MASALLAFTIAGTMDGLLALVRSPEELADSIGAMRVVFHCTAACAAVGVLIGVVSEGLVVVAERSHGLHWLLALVAAGPKTWFAPDPRVAARVIGWFVVAMGLVVAEFSAAIAVMTWLHAPTLIALAIALGTLLLVSSMRVAAGMVSEWFEERLQHRPRLASPVMAVLSCAALGLLAVVALLRDGSPWLHTLDGWRVGFVLGIAITFLIALAAGVRRRWRQSSSRSLVPTLAVLALVAGVVSARSVGAWPEEASIVANRSSLAGGFMPWLRAATTERDDIPVATTHLRGHGSNNRHIGPRMSFVVLSFDALRADHVGAYGYGLATTPHVDAFARTAARFVNAYAVTPNTVYSFATVWTGQYSSELAWSATEKPALLQPVTTLGATLRDAGYDTAMFTDTNYLRDTGALLDGFNVSDMETAFRGDTAGITARAAAWIRQRSNEPAPFLVWVHLIGPHQPYRDLPSPWRSEAGAAPMEMDRYDAEIVAADAAMQVVLDAVDVTQRNRPTTVIVMSDHGEAFGEHGHKGHGSSLHEEEIRVPLLIRAPDVVPGRRNAIASLIDLTPTLLDLARMPVREAMSGRSLVAVLDDPTVPMSGAGWRDAIHLELPATRWGTWNQMAEIAPPWAILWDEGHGTWELYNHAHDPSESQNLIERLPGVASTLQRSLLEWRSGHRPSVTDR